MNNLLKKLCEIQTKFKAPKRQFSEYGGFNYRSCEDILEALKPFLNELNLIININDEIIEIGNRFYLKATVKLIDIETSESISSQSLAREQDSKSKMDASQLTGACSSYARKYALNALLAIDDSKDFDFDYDFKNKTQEKVTENFKKNQPKEQNIQKHEQLTEKQLKRLFAIASKAQVNSDKVKEQVMSKFNKKIEFLNREEYDKVCEGYEKLQNKI